MRPNRLAAGVPFNLLQLEGDVRYVVLFVLAFIPLMLAFRQEQGSRGWLLASLGNALLLLTLIVPAQAGRFLLANAEAVLGEGVMLRNPRILPSVAMVLGLVGGYVVLFAGLRDLQRSHTPLLSRLVLAWAGVALVVVLFLTGQFDVYSVVVEFYANGATLASRFIQHFMYVAVALVIGFVIGVGLGLWAARDERVSQVILYAVGIIQTVPSLALFGVLLVPLARLGDQRFLGVLLFFVVTLALAALLLGLFRRYAAALPVALRPAGLIVSAVALAVPLALFVVVFASFIFRVSFTAFTGGRYPLLNGLILGALVLTLALFVLARYGLKQAKRRTLAYRSSLITSATLAVLLVVQYVLAGRVFLGATSLQTLTVRNLGVSGIGPAPALIALTLYALLPMVRNTYAGLNNVDRAIIDAGRGMGMTAPQRFFQLELPVALPIIMAGVRNAGVALVGIAAIASVIGAGGLGDLIFNGITSTSIDLILLGTLPAVLLAFALDALLRGLEQLFTSPGIRVAEEVS